MPRRREAASTTAESEEMITSPNGTEDSLIESFQMYYPKRPRSLGMQPQTVTILPAGKIILSSDLVGQIKDEAEPKGYVFLGYNSAQRQILIRRAKHGDRGVLRLSTAKPETNNRYQIAAKGFLEQYGILPATKYTCHAEWYENIRGVIATLPE